VKNTKSLNFTTKLKRIKKCANDNFYNILEFLSDNNNVNSKIRAHKHIRLTQLMHSNKFNEKFKERVTRATQSKRKSYEMLDFAKC